MREIGELFKSSLKILLRNKGFWFFLLAFPILSMLILNLKEDEVSKYKDKKDTEYAIKELSSLNSKVIYAVEGMEYYYTVKVYDSSKSELSDYVLEQLLDTGMVYICRYNSEKMTEAELSEQIKKDADNDKIGSILYFSSDFEEELLSGELENAVKLYRSSDDERKELVETTFKNELSMLLSLAKQVNGEKEQLLEVLETKEEMLPKKNVKQVHVDKTSSLNLTQKGYKQCIGFSFAVLTLCSLFGGIFISYTVIEERNNRILQRIMMSKTDIVSYIVSKILLSVFVSLLQTGIMAIGVFFVIKPEYGINRWEYLFLIAMQGIIFNTLSLCVGVLLGNAMSANYAAFTIWSISALLSGLYFPIDGTSGLFKNLSNLMPQYWSMKATEMFLTGDLSAYRMILCVTAAFLLVILSVGAVGLKMKQGE